MALISAGFTITASWPVHTESEHSLHQAKKNAAQSTILLVCRKRAEEQGSRGAEEQGSRGAGERILSSPPLLRPSAPVWWDDLAPRVRAVAREKAAEFNAQGIRGVASIGSWAGADGDHRAVARAPPEWTCGRPAQGFAPGDGARPGA